MTVARMMIAAVCALAAGVAVENAKATASCTEGAASHHVCVSQPATAAATFEALDGVRQRP